MLHCIGRNRSEKLYPRAGDAQTIYLNAAITNPNIKIGDYTSYNDFANDLIDFEKIMCYTIIPSIRIN